MAAVPDPFNNPLDFVLFQYDNASGGVIGRGEDAVHGAGELEVGATQPVIDGVGGRHGFGFSVQNFRGAPLLDIVFATEAESIAAEAAVRQAIESAVDIMSHSAP